VAGSDRAREQAPAGLRLAELVVGLSLVSDVGMGQEPGDAARACLIAVGLARRAGLADLSEVYYTSLLQHCGCTAFSHEAAELLGGDDVAAKAAGLHTDFGQPRQVLSDWLMELAPGASPLTRLRVAGTAIVRSGQIRGGYTTANCEVAAAIARRVGLPSGVVRGLGEIFEQWDGRGLPRGLGREDISAAARCAQVAGVASLFGRLGGAELAVSSTRRRGGRGLDPDLVDEYARCADELEAGLSGVDVLAAAVAAEPGPPLRITPGQLNQVCRAFGDAVDLKSVYLHGHSAAVAALAEEAGRKLGLPDADVAALRRAGHLQDLGRVGIPTGIWERPGPLTTADWERVRLHAYHSERLLSRCGPLADLAPLAGMHHERLDGSGYHRQAGAATIPMTARILAAADTFAALTSARPHRPAVEPEAASRVLQAEAAARRLDADAVRAVLVAAGQTPPVRPPNPDGLTDRQIDVLRLLARGLSNPDIARTIGVSRRTAEHHVQDIYARIGASSRAAAALYAMEHGLLH
jgi:HD-GYP domain-containing protein (c-di-GMP phosphodiesterase class II)